MHRETQRKTQKEGRREAGTGQVTTWLNDTETPRDPPEEERDIGPPASPHPMHRNRDRDGGDTRGWGEGCEGPGGGLGPGAGRGR